MKTGLSLLPVALLLTACTQTTEAPPALPAPAVNANTNANADVTLAASSGNELGLDVWKQLNGDVKANLAISPASISTAFAMTYLGARGETAEEMKRVLHLNGTPEEIAAAYSNLRASWKAAGKDVQLEIANRLFGEKTTTFSAPFLSLTRDAFGAELAPVDFRGAPDQSRAFINGWISDATHDKIKNLLPEGSITPDARLVLTNAIYFKGVWATPFDAKSTHQAPFTTGAGSKIDVPMMNQMAELGYSKKGGVTIAELPYAGGSMVMDIVIPDDAKGLPALEAKLNAAELEGLLSGIGPREIQLSLPRFKVAPEGINLRAPLKSLGLKRAFDAVEADFSGMDQHKDLYISAAFHKAFVEVNEKGTEAAAATAVVMTKESAMIPTQVVADHPFLFVLRDIKSKSVLFLGRVSDPSKS